MKTSAQTNRAHAIAHAETLAAETRGVITLLQVATNPPTFDFGCAYVDSAGAVYNALPPQYWTPEMAGYRRRMPEYRLIRSAS